jgi:hypothetical protein
MLGSPLTIGKLCRRRAVRLGVIAAVGAATLGLAPAAHAAETLYQLSGAELFAGPADEADATFASLTISGTTGNPAAIDVQPSTGDLFLLTLTTASPFTGQLYKVDVGTGAATPLPSSIALGTSNPGDADIDFDPTTGVLRFVDAIKQNLRLDPTTGALLGTDTALARAPGDPHAAVPPSVGAAAYDDPASGGATLFDLDNAGNPSFLLRQGSPGGSPSSAATGLLSTIATTGFSAASPETPLGLDISSVTGDAYASRSVSTIFSPFPDADIFRLNLADGTAKIVGFPGLTTDIALAPTSRLDLAAADSDTTEGAPATVTVTRSGPGLAKGTVTVAYATSDGNALAGSDYTPESGTLTFAPGETTKSFTVPTLDDTAVEGREALLVTLSAPTGDKLGGATTGRDRSVVTIEDNDSAPPGQTGATPPPNPPPGLFGVELTHTSFTAKHRAAFRYVLTKAATVTISITGKASGRVSAKKCVAPTKRNAKAKTCTIALKGTVTARGKLGDNTTKVPAGLGGKALAKGTYKVTLQARDPAGQKSAVRKLSFKVL